MSRNLDIFGRDTVNHRGGAAVGHGPKDHASTHPRDGHAIVEDEIAKLVQRVFLLPATTGARGAVAFCGIDAGAGCSWVCARAGEVLAAHAPGTVCVVDANLRSPSLHEYFRMEKAPGFADAMKDTRPIGEFARPVRPLRSPKLWLVTAGAVDTGPNGALNPARLRTRFSELRAAFDHLLIDTPPMSRYVDAVLLSQLTDGVILVVGWHSTRREPARIAKESFEAAGVPMLGAVLNKRSFPIPQALYRRL